MPYKTEQIKERYDKLPADVKQAMDSVDTTNAVVDIGEKHDLMYDQISELVDEVGLVMIGLTPEAMFVNNIARRMQVDMGKAMLIARDINKGVFDKMRASLKKIEGGDEGGFSDESGNSASAEKIRLERGEETLMTDAEKAEKSSVVSAVEKAGGFVIDKPDQAPLRAEEMVSAAMRESLESKKNIVNVIEKDSLSPAAKAEPAIAPDHLLGDTPETNVRIPDQQTQTPDIKTKQPDQASIVDTLLAKGVAMTMDSNDSKPEKKVRPYDGTDPYRETLS